MAHVAVELLEDLAIHLVGIFVVLAVSCSPLVQMLHDNLQVAHTVLAGLDSIVTEGFGLCCRVDRRQEFLLSIPIHRIVSMGLDPLVQNRLLIFRSSGLIDRLVTPTDRIVIIYTKPWRKKPCYAVTRLSHIIVTGIVHYGRSGTVFVGEGLAAERIHRISIRRPHVVHKTESVSDFMNNKVSEKRSHLLCGIHLPSGCRLHCRSLDE